MKIGGSCTFFERVADNDNKTQTYWLDHCCRVSANTQKAPQTYCRARLRLLYDLLSKNFSINTINESNTATMCSMARSAKQMHFLLLLSAV
jgi:hypothetical protein